MDYSGCGSLVPMVMVLMVLILTPHIYAERMEQEDLTTGSMKFSPHARVKKDLQNGLREDTVDFAPQESAQTKLQQDDLNEDFGDVARIIGGTVTSASVVPWQVLVLTTPIIEDGTGIPFGICGGSVISLTWIMSAAHCVAEGAPNNNEAFVIKVKRISLYAGITDAVNRDIDPNRQVNVINEEEFKEYVFINEDYKKGSPENNDITLFKLKNPLTKTKTVEPINLATVADFCPGKKLSVSGWGSISVSGEGYPRILRRATGLNLISRSECKASWGPRLTDNMICHKTNEKSSCIGDSGGAVITGRGGSSEPPYVQIGIVSFGRNNSMVICDAIAPTVFVDVAKFRDWIDATMSGVTGSDCEDSNSRCPKYAEEGKCRKRKFYFKCKETCACKGSDCKDNSRKCPQFARNRKCSKPNYYFKCKESCACGSQN